MDEREFNYISIQKSEFKNKRVEKLSENRISKQESDIRCLFQRNRRGRNYINLSKKRGNKIFTKIFGVEYNNKKLIKISNKTIIKLQW